MCPCLTCMLCPGPSSFQKAATNQSLHPRWLLIGRHERGGVAGPSSALPQKHVSNWGASVGPPGRSSKASGLWLAKSDPRTSPSKFPGSTPSTMSSLPSLMAPESTRDCQLGRGACPKSSPGSAMEVSGTESRGSL